MAPRQPHLTIERFQDHWRDQHGAVAGAIPGVRHYVQNHAVVDGGGYLLPYPGFDACSEMAFDDVASIEHAFASPHYQDSVRQDEQAFIDGSRHSLVVGDRRVLKVPDPLAAIKLITLFRLHPAAQRTRLLDVAAGEYHDHVSADLSVLGHEQIVPLDELDMAATNACELVDIVWFADARAALVALRSGGVADGWLALAGAILGAANLIAKPMEVVSA